METLRSQRLTAGQQQEVCAVAVRIVRNVLVAQCVRAVRALARCRDTVNIGAGQEQAPCRLCHGIHVRELLHVPDHRRLNAGGLGGDRRRAVLGREPEFVEIERLGQAARIVVRLDIEIELLDVCGVQAVERSHRQTDEALVALGQRDAAVARAAPCLGDRSGADRRTRAAPGIVFRARRGLEVGAIVHPKVEIELAAELRRIDPEPEHLRTAPYGINPERGRLQAEAVAPVVAAVKVLIDVAQRVGRVEALALGQTGADVLREVAARAAFGKEVGRDTLHIRDAERKRHTRDGGTADLRGIDAVKHQRYD